MNIVELVKKRRKRAVARKVERELKAKLYQKGEEGILIFKKRKARKFIGQMEQGGKNV